jgi:hypothetical protein
MNIRLKGHVVLEARDEQGRLVARREVNNLWTTVGKSFVANTLAAVAGYNVGVTYCAIGIGVTEPALTDTILTNEATRKAVSSRTVTGTQLVISTFFTAAESTYMIKEIGLFGHSDATATVNTGKLFAHALLDYDNATSATNVTITWTLSVG